MIGIGYSAYFAYNWVANPESRGELDKTLTKIDDETGINLKAVASAIRRPRRRREKSLAEQAEEVRPEQAVQGGGEGRGGQGGRSSVVRTKASRRPPAVAAKPAGAKKTFKEAVKEAVKEAENK